MIHRYPVHLSTMEEDFRAIGLISENELHEVDTPQNPRDIPSPDPSTLGGEVDDSEKEVARRSRHSTGMQPRPKIAPSEKDDHDDAMDAGGAQKKGKGARSYNKAPNYREDREYREAYEGNPRASIDDGYKTLKKRVMGEPPKGIHYDDGQDPDRAEGLSSVEVHAGMKRNSGKKAESASMNRAAQLVQEVEDLIAGSAIDEELDELRRGFALVGENAILLGDRLLSLAEEYEVDGLYEALHELAQQASEALDIIEMKVSFEKDKAKSIKNGEFHYEDEEDEDDIAVEDIQEAFRAMTLHLMDAVELYDGTLNEMVMEANDDDDDDDDDGDDDDDDDDDDDKKEESVSARLASLREHRARFGRGPT